MKITDNVTHEHYLKALKLRYPDDKAIQKLDVKKYRQILHDLFSIGRELLVETGNFNLPNTPVRLEIRKVKRQEIIELDKHYVSMIPFRNCHTSGYSAFFRTGHYGTRCYRPYFFHRSETTKAMLADKLRQDSDFIFNYPTYDRFNAAIQSNTNRAYRFRNFSPVQDLLRERNASEG